MKIITMAKNQPDKLMDKNGRIIDCWIKSETKTDYHVIMIDDNDHATHHVFLKSQFDRTGNLWLTTSRKNRIEELSDLITTLGLTADNLRLIADSMDNPDLPDWSLII